MPRGLHGSLRILNPDGVEIRMGGVNQNQRKLHLLELCRVALGKSHRKIEDAVHAPALERTAQIIFGLPGMIDAVQDDIEPELARFVLYPLQNLYEEIIGEIRNDRGERVG